MTKKIAFGYKMGSGKDTCATFLCDKYGGKILAFADPLYDLLHIAQLKCGFPHIKDRKFLQFIGTEWARGIDDMVWVKQFLKSASVISDAPIYCSDLRFINEAEALKENGWTLVKIMRNETENRVGTGDALHCSETELDKFDNWDYVIENNGSLEELYEKINEIYRS